MDTITDRKRWENLLRDKSWEEIHVALGLWWRRERGGKIVSPIPCFECEIENVVVCRPDGTFVCRQCRAAGDKAQFVLGEGEMLFPLYEVPNDDEIMEFVCGRLPQREDHRQLKLFYHKKFWPKKPVPFYSVKAAHPI